MDEIQGYFLSKPVAADAIESMILNPDKLANSSAKIIQLHP
ncbi:MAG: hypothetical protein ACO3DT_02805 [Gammaproteobacteria bacterium]